MKKLLKNKELLIVFILTIIGGFLRFYNLNWDSGHFFHPDERNIDMAVSKINFFSQLNPGFFAYGSFSMYLYRLLGEVFATITKSHVWVYDWEAISLIGRSLSALFSTTTIPLIFLLAKKIFDKKVAYVSAIIATFTVSFIQSAHFSTTESLLILLATSTCLLSLIIFHNPSLKNYIFTGIVLGISVATKITSLSFILFMFASQAVILLKNKHGFFKKNLFFTIFLLVGFLTFTLSSPYVFLNSVKFLESMEYESGVAIGSLSVVYTLQFDKTIPYLFQIKNFFWQMGPIALFSLLGLVLLAVKTVIQKNYKLFIFLSFPLIYFFYAGYWHTKFIRYMVLILPFLIIAASYFLVVISTKLKTIGKSLSIVILSITILWAFAFFSIYTREQTRIKASKWIYQNIPIGSKILGEHWDDGLPVTIQNNTSSISSIYSIEQLTIYEPDNQNKINYYAEQLSTADYIVLNSRRLYGTLINLPEKYPITSKYYKILFNNQLGYEKIAEFKSYPSIFGIEINDDSSEETFQVYDHPKVMVFKNTGRFSKNQLSQLLNEN